MQSQRNKKSTYLFEVLLDSQELRELVHINQDLLKKFIQLCSKHLLKIGNHHSRKKVYFFLANYKQIMELHSRVIKDVTSVNLSLHFALLFTFDLMSENQLSYAKTILKQTQQYLSLDECDMVLLSICMNNLALLHLRSAHPKKALAACLNGIGAMEEHLDKMRCMKNRRRIIEDGVIFVNLLLIAKRSLDRIIKQGRNDATFRKLLKMINRLGYNFSLKYLGATSIFTSKFECNSDSIDLPVYDTTQTESEYSDKHGDFEMRLAEELNHIYHMLKDIKMQPEVYYIKQHLVGSRQNSEGNSIEVIQQLPSNVPERSVCHVEHIVIDNWDTELSILKTNGLSPDKEFQFLGHLQFRLSKGRRNQELMITEESMFKIIHIINVYDILPYEIEIKKITSQEFAKRLLVGFLMASEEGELQILPRARPVVDPFELRFCGERSFVFINHVRFRRFRVAICPTNSCDTMYLQVEFKHKETDNLFKVKEIQHDFIYGFSKKYHPEENYTQQYNFAPYKSVDILSHHFLAKIKQILREFQFFLSEEEENRMSDMSTVINFSENYLYYQFTEFKEGIGQFHMLKYRSNANHIELNLKNLFRTHTPAGEDYVKGTAIYSPQQFLKDFSIPLKASKRHLPAFSELILQKFSLKIYSSPLAEEEEDLFDQNAIIEVPITSKCYSRRFLPFENYVLPVTIEVITVNNEKPIGIRVTAYEPLKGTHSGIFIHVTPEYWQRPLAKEEVVEEENANGRVKRSTEDYNFKKCYFLTAWMEEHGFDLIFDRLEIANRALELRGVGNKFVRLDELLRLE